MKTILYFVILLSVIISGCKNQSNAADDGSSSPDPALIKCWANSFEEETQDNVRIYRPCATHTFPAARYRDTFTIKENGEVEYSVMEADDAHTTANGTWTYDADKKKLSIMSPGKEKVHEYEVVELGEDILKLKGN